jgi:DUF4097 and DUF4098 domain-containing protein YvlB
MRLLLCSILGLVAAQASANECKFTADRPLDIDPAGLHALVLKLDSSDVRVRGVAGLAKIEIHGKACASDESWLADLTVKQVRDGDRVVVTANQRPQRTINWFGSTYASIDFEVRMPAALPLQIDSNSGDADVADIATLDFTAHSGDLNVHNVAGAVGVEVGSGDIKADDVGSLDLRRSGSGDVRAKNVRGEVTVGHVGSGDLGFAKVQKSIHVASVGSGDVNVDNAGGDVVIDSIGSGDVSASDINGNFVVKAAGSGDIHHRNVKGKVTVPHGDDDEGYSVRDSDNH